MGGISEEKKISILSGKACVRALKKKKYKVKVLDPKGNFINEIRKIKPKIIFNDFIFSTSKPISVKHSTTWFKFDLVDK